MHLRTPGQNSKYGITPVKKSREERIKEAKELI